MLRARIQSSIATALANKGLIALAASALAKLNIGRDKLLSVSFSITRIGNNIEVVPNVVLQRDNPEAKQYFINGLMAICKQIRFYLESNLALYPTMLNGDNIDYSSGIAVSVSVPFTNPELIASR